MNIRNTQVDREDKLDDVRSLFWLLAVWLSFSELLR